MGLSHSQIPPGPHQASRASGSASPPPLLSPPSVSSRRPSRHRHCHSRRSGITKTGGIPTLLTSTSVALSLPSHPHCPQRVEPSSASPHSLAPHLVNEVILIYWPSISAWVECDVIEYGGQTGDKRGLHRVRFADGLCEWMTLSSFRLVMSAERFAETLQRGEIGKLRGKGRKMK